jgi:hypothetical protein
MGVCCGSSNRKIIYAKDQGELKQFIDEEIKIVKQNKIPEGKELDANSMRIKNELIAHCEEISNNLGRFSLKFNDFEGCKNQINELFVYVESEDYENSLITKKAINEKYFNE